MLKKYKEPAFSLTELLVVMVIISVLFAAMAPIMTKRRLASNVNGDEPIWSYVIGDQYLDSYYNPGVNKWASIAFIGLDPSNLSNADDKMSGGKLTLRANSKPKEQNQIQFRIGSNTGSYAGALHISRTNMLLGSDFNAGSTYSTVVGLNAGKHAVDSSTSIGSYSRAAKKSVSVGFGSLGMRESDAAEPRVTYVGANSGGAYNDDKVNDTVGLGYNTLSSSGLAGRGNTAIGHSVGAYLTGETPNDIDDGSQGFNVLAGSKYYGTKAHGNTILGYGVYENGNPEMNYMTAAGYGACASITTSGTKGSRTCLGYSSAVSSNGSTFNDATDDYDHIYLGGKPATGFPGRAVLEVHNTGSVYNTNRSSASVVLNSNLVVRGALISAYYEEPTRRMDYHGFDGVSQSFFSWKGSYCDDDYWFGWPLNKYFCEPLRNLNSARAVSENIMTENTSGVDMGIGNKNYYKYFGGSYSKYYPTVFKSSDINLKENLSESGIALADMLKLQPYNYTFKSDKNKVPQVGVIAQDLEKVFPNAVTKAKDGYLRVRWDDMFFGLINAVKALNSKLELIAYDIINIGKDAKNVENSNKLLKQKVAELSARAAKLEQRK